HRGQHRLAAIVPSTSITVAGTVTAGASDVPVTVTVNGAQAQVAGGQFTSTLALSSGPNTINVIVTDSFGQTAESPVTVISDTTPPLVALGAIPGTVQPGARYQITAYGYDSDGNLATCTRKVTTPSARTRLITYGSTGTSPTFHQARARQSIELTC